MIKPNQKGKLPHIKKALIYHEPGSITINLVEELKALYPKIKIEHTVPSDQHARKKVPIKAKEAIDKEINYLLVEEIVTGKIKPTPSVSPLHSQGCQSSSLMCHTTWSF